MKKKIALLLCLTVMCFALAACGDSGSSSGTETPKLDITAMTAEQIAQQFVDAGYPIGKVIVYTEETDSNNLLGRPNQYTSKTNFSDSRVEQYDEDNNPVGGSIEVFNNKADAQSRYDYVDTVSSSSPLFVQYMYIYENVLLRVDGALTPEQAAEYETGFNSLCEGTSPTYTAAQ